MTLPEHAACSFLLAQFSVRERLGTRGVVLVTLAGILPDADTATKLVSDTLYWKLHHALGHNLFSIALLSAALALVGRLALKLRPFFYLFGWCLAAALVHCFTDALYWFPVEPFWPFF
jgi:membrane-bound metal-dependent hydrolase YbcI (DUF457 family)